MSDQFHSNLWDIEPTCQVCGIGENDTIIVDGLYAGLIEWDRFHDVFQEQPWQTLTGRVVRIAGAAWLISLSLLNYIGESSSTHWALNLGLTTGEWSVIIAFLLLIPLGGPLIFSRRTVEEEEMNARLFGFEGYMPLEKIEEKLWGCNLEKLSWNAHGSTLSHHKAAEPYTEPAFTFESGFIPHNPGEDLSLPIKTYPVEPLNPVRAETGTPGGLYRRHTLTSLQEQAKRNYGEMKVCQAIHTFKTFRSMYAPLITVLTLIMPLERFSRL